MYYKKYLFKCKKNYKLMLKKLYKFKSKNTAN